MVRVPGFTHPVEDFYLEEVLRLVQYQVPREAQGQRGGQQHTWHKARPGRGLGLGTVHTQDPWTARGGKRMDLLPVQCFVQGLCLLCVVSVCHEGTPHPQGCSSSHRINHPLFVPPQQVPRAQRAAVQAAVEAAFKDDSDAAFEHLLSTLGLGMDGDGAVSAHVLDVQHEATGGRAG